MDFTEATATGAVLASFQGAPDPRLREVLVGTGEPCVVSGQVRSLDGTPLAGALVDVWQADDHGFYDVQQPGTHIHFIVAADGHLPVTTHVFVAGSPYLDSDAVFAVKQCLVRDFAAVDDPAQAAAFGVPAPFRHAIFDVVLQPAPDPEPG